MGAEREGVSKEKKCRKENSTVKLVWKNVRKIRTRETDGIGSVDEEK